MLTPLCLSQEGNDGGGERHEEWEQRKKGALKKYNVARSSLHSEVTVSFCSHPMSLHLKQNKCLHTIMEPASRHPDEGYMFFFFYDDLNETLLTEECTKEALIPFG